MFPVFLQYSFFSFAGCVGSCGVNHGVAFIDSIRGIYCVLVLGWRCLERKRVRGERKVLGKVV